eukprot:1914549-Rhodomonas_salina.2
MVLSFTPVGGKDNNNMPNVHTLPALRLCPYPGSRARTGTPGLENTFGVTTVFLGIPTVDQPVPLLPLLLLAVGLLLVLVMRFLTAGNVYMAFLPGARCKLRKTDFAIEPFPQSIVTADAVTSIPHTHMISADPCAHICPIPALKTQYFKHTGQH